MPRPDALSLAPAGPRPSGGRLCALLLPALLAAWPVSAGAAGPDDDLKRIERQIEESQGRSKELERDAERMAREMRDLQRQSVRIAARAQEHEETVLLLEERLAELGKAEKRTRHSLALRRDDLSGTIGALSRMGRRPPEALAASPGRMVDSLRASFLLASVVPSLKSEAAELSNQLSILKDLQGEIAAERSRLKSASRSLEAEREQLARVLTLKKGSQARLNQQRRDEGRRLKKLAGEAKDLQSLIAKLEEDQQRRAEEAAKVALEAVRRQDSRTRIVLKPPKPASIAPQAHQSGASPLGRDKFSGAQGALSLPVRGRMIETFGQSTHLGKSKGLSIETAPGATVVAPYDGQIAFAGPFRRYGLLLIISHGEGYHTLLAGLSRIDGEVGQTILAGEPVGNMGLENTSETNGSGKPVLYLEMRRKGAPINPLPWLAARERKVSG